MRAVNLLPPNREPAGAAASRTRLSPLHIGAGVVGVATIAGLALLVVNASSNVSAKQQQLASLQTQVSKLAVPLPAAPTAASSVPSRKSSVVALSNARLPWDSFLATFSKVVPEDVWLTTLQASAPGAAATVSASTAAPSNAVPATATSGNTFTLSGYTYSQPSVARLMRRLELIPWLSGVTLNSSAVTQLDNKNVVAFTVAATVVPDPQEAP
jgi:Tfp pilus assembly protein PilN